MISNISQIMDNIFKKFQKSRMNWKLRNYVSVIENYKTLYLKKAFGRLIEFPNEAGVFQLDAFLDLTVFIVLSEETRVVQANFANTTNSISIAGTPNTSTITTRPSRNLSRRALACVKTVRIDMENNGKPSNLRLHNHAVHVNIYTAKSKHA